jgi:tRNA(Arg) A34 adenosine deaminase TadA
MLFEYALLNKLIQRMKHRKMTRHHYNVGAVCASKKGQILSIGLNSYHKTHPIMLKYSYERKEQCFLHAEIAALASCKETPYILIIARLGNLKKISLAKPCPGCLEFIKTRNIKKVYHTNDNGSLTLLDETNYLYLGRKII